ncbi:zinc finger and btb domain-containing protein 11 [Limosa lapponica baueri]|uniref:Zinc finger and btb domain-containing protein 11 n=1 Tax=Limosa lapponica baueri TaxID=1758121 RepID=A0A2I0U706_LIMLA|nr:zinc finger and btb domain-containing protein 11 [Limosa lapponica baueri]
MSSEESYLAILRYLTNEREPYAPGTEGNAKRKIRKAAACYVVRGGTLYYQRRQRDQQRFAELEVVLQAERRARLIRAAHLAPDGAHRTRLQTWQGLSQKYWWRGILKQVKDYIKECSKCQEKLDRSRSLSDPSEMLEELGLDAKSHEDSNETDDELSNTASIPAASPKPVKKKPIAKHELVFVDSKGLVKQSSSKHCLSVLNQLNQQRLSNQFCDVTLLIEGEEYKAHKSVLAANSEYFRELFIEKGAVSSHEAVVDLSELTFDFCSMAEVAMLARHLFMSEVIEICENVHKQMEEKQITVYQKGDIQTVESTQNLGQQTEVVTQPVDGAEQPELTASEVPVAVNGAPSSAGTEEGAALQPDLLPPEPVEATPDDLSKPVEQGETTENYVKMQLLESISNSTVSVVEAEPLAVEAMDTQSHTEVETDQNDSGKANVDTASEDSSETLQQKRGRQSKEQSVSVSQPESLASSQDDTYKSKLRQRSVSEGGYIRLHKGIEKKLQNRKTNPKSAIQQVCGKTFTYKHGLKMHLALHEVQKQFKCDLCEKSFVTKRSLQEHMSIHTGVKPFECLTCGVAWADARSLKRHVRTHTGERPYVCPVCNEAYIDARTLRKHMTKFHRDYVPCKIMLEKDTLQFHNQGTQVEHAISILAADVQEQETEISVGGGEIETVVVTGETIEAIEAVAATEECTSVSTLSDQSIMQVVNYVLAQQQGQKMAEVTQAIETVEVEVAHVTKTD